jgi:hypothetical protein
MVSHAPINTHLADMMYSNTNYSVHSVKKDESDAMRDWGGLRT